MSSVFVLRRVTNYLFSLETKLLGCLGLRPPFQDEIPVLDTGNTNAMHPEQRTSLLNEIFGNGFLWAVPAHRRSIERRLTRKLAKQKLMKPKRNLILCLVCGHHHESHTICGNCYEKVRKETEEMKAAIQKELNIDPVDKEIVVVYDDDKKGDFWEGKRIVEMKKQRPLWFQQNLQVRTMNPDPSKENSVQPTKSIIPNVK